MSHSQKAQNINRQPLQPCSIKPMTGYFRDGYCNTDASDVGTHVVCAQVTEQFLKFTKQQGNDLSTPSPQYRFPGLRPGDKWCLCALRWLEAYNAGIKLYVDTDATHIKALDYVDHKTITSVSEIAQ